MASRQEEKEARRKARLEQEQAERKAEARRKRLQLVLGGILAVGIVAGVLVAILAGSGGGESSASGGDGPATAEAPAGVELPAQQTSDIEEAVEASGCTLTHPADEGRGHEDREFTPADYETNPPTSGTHFPEWAQDGIYDTGNTPPLGELVHTLEHGRINVQYAPGTDPQLVRQLEAFVAENEGYHMLLYENTTDMDVSVAATTWTHSLTCSETGPEMWDALRTFRDRYIDKGPEYIP